ncbi:hypothetical protein TWF569_003429 [Orbilia oligospora]|nr:hypothetical protein TWF594_007699 [Orbilia oligospora]KAF3151710.1 hypothetical protein TWF569_003429 [Orbilia oligospora]
MATLTFANWMISSNLLTVPRGSTTSCSAKLPSSLGFRELGRPPFPLLLLLLLLMLIPRWMRGPTGFSFDGRGASPGCGFSAPHESSQGANYRAPGRRSPGKRPCQNRPTNSLHFSDQMRWVEIDLVKLWDRQIRESAMARRTLSSEYERLMAAMRQHADEHFGGEAAKPRGGPRTTLQWVVKNFDVSYYAEYPLRDIKLELRTNLRE